MAEGQAALAYKAVIFDCDGCLTKTASVHSRAWKKMFDEYLQSKDGDDFQEFTPEDYLKYVDGKPRYDGVQSFLESRSIDLPRGDPSDAPGKADITCCSLGNRKNDAFLQVLAEEGVEAYPSTVRVLSELQARGIRVACASSSKNAESVTAKGGVAQYLEARVDGVVAAELGLKGKPAGDIFVEACSRVGVAPKEAIVVEDAESGVAAGRAGNFRLVLGLARENNEDELKEHGAHVVLDDFGDTTLEQINAWFLEQPVPEGGELQKPAKIPKKKKAKAAKKKSAKKPAKKSKAKKASKKKKAAKKASKASKAGKRKPAKKASKAAKKKPAKKLSKKAKPAKKAAKK